MFGDGIRRRTDLRQHAGSARGRREVPATRRQPFGQQVLGSPTVRMHVYVERGVPVGFGCRQIGAHGDASIGEEQINWSGQSTRFGDESFVLSFACHIGHDRVRRVGATSVQSRSDRFESGARAITQDDGGTCVVKSFTKCCPNATSGACNDGDCATKLHTPMLGGHMPRGVVRIRGRRSSER
ncbi:MAG: hypothetical protein RLZZ332_779 [Actinomycetota bacterium]